MTLAVFLVAALGLGAYFLLPAVVVNDDVFLKGKADAAAREEQRLKARNDARTSGVALLTLFALATGSVLTWRTVRATRDGQTVDRLARAVESLGHGDATQRQGAIYTLGNVARSSTPERETAVRLLVEFIRVNAGPWSAQQAPTAPRRVPPEVNAAAEALGRRRARSRTRTKINLSGLDLRNVGFAGADLRHANLRGSNLSGAFLEDAALEGASLNGAVLRSAHLDRTRLRRADLTDADLTSSRVGGADFRRATLTRADLGGVSGKARGLPRPSGR